MFIIHDQNHNLNLTKLVTNLILTVFLTLTGKKVSNVLLWHNSLIVDKPAHDCLRNTQSAFSDDVTTTNVDEDTIMLMRIEDVFLLYAVLSESPACNMMSPHLSQKLTFYHRMSDNFAKW